MAFFRIESGEGVKNFDRNAPEKPSRERGNAQALLGLAEERPSFIEESRNVQASLYVQKKPCFFGKTKKSHTSLVAGGKITKDLWRFRRARSQETTILLWLNRGMPKLLWLQVEKYQASLVETKENPKKRPCLLGKSQEAPILYWREPRKAKETWLFHQRNTLANAIP